MSEIRRPLQATFALAAVCAATFVVRNYDFASASAPSFPDVSTAAVAEGPLTGQASAGEGDQLAPVLETVVTGGRVTESAEATRGSAVRAVTPAAHRVTHRAAAPHRRSHATPATPAVPAAPTPVVTPAAAVSQGHSWGHHKADDASDHWADQRGHDKPGRDSHQADKGDKAATKAAKKAEKKAEKQHRKDEKRAAKADHKAAHEAKHAQKQAQKHADKAEKHAGKHGKGRH